MLSLLVTFYVALFYSLLHIIFRESLSRSVLCLIHLYLIIQWYLFYLLVAGLVIDGCYHQIFFFLMLPPIDGWYHQGLFAINVFLPSMSFLPSKSFLPSRSFTIKIFSWLTLKVFLNGHPPCKITLCSLSGSSFCLVSYTLHIILLYNIIRIVIIRRTWVKLVIVCTYPVSYTHLTLPTKRIV